MAIRNWKDIPLFKDVTDEQWNDWHWQVANRAETVEDLKKYMNLTPDEVVAREANALSKRRSER